MGQVLAKPTKDIQHAFTEGVFWLEKLYVASQGKVPVLGFANVDPCILFGALLLSVRLYASTEIHASGFLQGIKDQCLLCLEIAEIVEFEVENALSFALWK